MALDLEGQVLAWNEGARRNYGYSADEMVGKQSSSILHVREDLESGKVKAFLDTALRGGKAEGVFDRVRKNGQRFTASVAASLRRDAAGAPIGFVLISKDITEQKRLEEQLRRKNEELEEQNRRVQEANRLKSEFLANMSHELRTPLNGIIGFAELMHDGKVGPVSTEHKEYLGDILTSARHLLQLINDVLDLAKVESGKMQFRPEPVNVGKLVTEVRDILRALTTKKRIAVQTEVDEALGGVVVDPAKLKQVLYNYLSNALKFTPDEGHVTVRFTSEGPEAFRLEVEDTGIGIRPEDVGRLFVEFQQLDASTAKKYPGTGLGLALTKRIVEAQGGKVGVRSTPGKGSAFMATLPRVPAAGRELEPRPRTVPSVSSPEDAPVVLVIEDDVKDRTWITRTLTEAGYAVETAATGTEALDLAQKRAYAAITLDLLLPDMSGWDVLRGIRTSGPNKDAPAIVVSVVSEKGASLGFTVQEFLVKPVNAETLVGAVRRAAGPSQDAAPVLVVDDDRKALKIAEQALKDSGYHPICEPDGESGLRAAAKKHPAVVVLDLLMPGMDGFEFLRRFRRTQAGRRTPVIVWTVKDLTVEERRRLQASAQAVVLKGDRSTDALLAEIQTHVTSRGR
ncbi:MAG: response regulator [Planctomycetes bacterium]|nr:response regulator [Planctomycetota bacterium]